MQEQKVTQKGLKMNVLVKEYYDKISGVMIQEKCENELLYTYVNQLRDFAAHNNIQIRG